MDYVLALFADRRPDLVVPIGGPAVRFAQRHQEKLFATTPMLIAAVDRRHVQPTTLTTNDAVVAVGLEPTGLLANILQVLPATTNIAMVFGDSPLERFWVKEFLRESERFTNRTRFTWVNGFPFDQIRQRVARLGPHFPR